MATLNEQLLGPDTRPRLIRDCAALLDDQVARKSGLSGIAVKGAYKTVKAIKPGFIEGVLEVLLPEWVAELEDDYARWLAGERAQSFGAWVTAHRAEVAEELLHVTDRRAEGTRHTTAKKLYQKLRGGAKTQVEQAVPDLAELVDRYLEDAAP